jgi:histidinol-phosphate aminotransferase
MDIRKLVKPNVRALRPYETKEIPASVKLDANESPYGLPFLRGIRTNRYPDPEARELKKTFAGTIGTRPENILVGNGSDELIYHLISTFGGPVLYPVPTFSMYGIIAQVLGEKRIEVPLDGQFDLDMKNTMGAIGVERPKLVFLSSPNNPTGNCFSEEKITEVIKRTRGVVVVDEAYLAFSGRRGFVSRLRDFPNLVIMKTMSKIGLAALRVGFLVAEPSVIREVNKVRLPFNLNSVSQALAVRALKEKRGLRSSISAVVSERKRLFREMSAMEGVKAYPSEANFILFRVRNPRRVHSGLLEKGVLVRDMKGVVAGCLRVTVGTERENDAFLKALKTEIKGGS